MLRREFTAKELPQCGLINDAVPAAKLAELVAQLLDRRASAAFANRGISRHTSSSSTAGWMPAPATR